MLPPPRFHDWGGWEECFQAAADLGFLVGRAAASRPGPIAKSMGPGFLLSAEGRRHRLHLTIAKKPRLLLSERPGSGLALVLSKISARLAGGERDHQLALALLDSRPWPDDQPC